MALRLAAATTMEGIIFDLRFAMRRLRRDAWIALTAVVCLALGMASIVSIVRVADAALFGAPPGVRGAAAVRRLYEERSESAGKDYGFFWSYSTLSQFARVYPSRIGVSGLHLQDLAVVVDATPERVDGALIAGPFFEVLNLRPFAGRQFSKSQLAAEALVSYRFASARLGGLGAALGRTIRIGRRPYVIVGVLPVDFLGTELQPVDVWLPALATRSEYLPPGWDADPTATLFRAFARISSAADEARFIAGATAVYQRAAEPSLSKATPPRVIAVPLPISRDPTRTTDALLSETAVLLASLLWVAVCANVANLVLARAIARRSESVLCLALGGSPARLLRLWAFEIVTLILLSCVAGLLVATQARHFFVAAGLIQEIQTYRSNAFHVAVAIFIASAIAAGAAMWMAVREARRVDLASSLTGVSRAVVSSRHRAQRALLVVEVGVCTALLYGAGLFITSFRNARNTPLGFQDEDLYVASGNTWAAGLSLEETDRLFSVMAERARAVPGVIAASVGVSVPFSISLGVNVHVPAGSGSEISYINVVSPSYFRTVGIPIVRGREFDARVDSRGAMPAAIISEGLARALFGEVDPIGRCVVIVPDGACRTVVGISADAMQVNLRTRVTNVYVSLDQAPKLLPSRTLFFRVTPQNRELALAGTRAAVQQAARDIPITVNAVSALVAAELRPWKLEADLLGAFSVIAVTVLAIGVFGVVSYWASRWLPEIGLRIALGATPYSIFALILTSLAPVLCLGIIVGLAGGMIVGRSVSTQLLGVSELNSAVALLAIMTPVAATTIALVRPMSKLLRVQPADALRST